MKPATPLPWRIGDRNEVLGNAMEGALKDRPKVVSGARKTADDKADARFIVHAANHHQRLVDELRTCLTTLPPSEAILADRVRALLVEIGDA